MHDPILQAQADLARAVRDDRRSAAIAEGREAGRRAHRRTMEEPEPPRLILEGASARQRAAMCSGLDDLLMRCRAAPAALRGWRLMDLPSAPAGSRSVAMLVPTAPHGRLVRLAADAGGRLRLVTGDNRLGAAVSVSEAANIAAGRIAPPGE